MDTRLRVGRVIEKTEEEIAPKIMQQIKRYQPDEKPPAIASDGKGAYREAILETWGELPEYSGRGRPPTAKIPRKDWHYLQIIKNRKGRKLLSVKAKVIYGDPEEVKRVLGEHTAYIERTNLTSRQMNGRLVRKTLSFDSLKPLQLLKMAFTISHVQSRFCALSWNIHQKWHAGNNAALQWLLASLIIYGRLKSF